MMRLFHISAGTASGWCPRQAMPSIADSKKLVQESIGSDIDHDAVLRSLRHEIDSHNQQRAHTQARSRRHRSEQERSEHNRADSALRFHFKHDKHRSLRDRQRRKHRKHDRVQTHEYPDTKKEVSETSHPFPREPTSPTAEPSDDAFLSSLLDALADDEAASYWESVYSQPIHTYERPAVKTESGSIEHMNDEEYAAWVKRKMWEKSHPEIIAERLKAEERQREEDELKRRRKEEFVRRRQREAWSHASRAKDDDDDRDYVFDFTSTNSTSRAAAEAANNSRWQHAWISYLEAWERLKSVNISEHQGDVSKLLPWPVLPGKPPTKAHIEQFLQNMPRADPETSRRLLKAERVRWHPDKVQHRFAGRVDEGTMKVVTGIFQAIDALWTAQVAKQ